MNTTAQTAPPADLIDHLVGLTPGDALHAVRHQRDKVVRATQVSYDALLSPDVEGLTQQERLLVGWYAASLTPCPDLAAHYRALVDVTTLSEQALDAIASDRLDQLQASRLLAILRFVRTLITDPVRADKALLHTLPAAGLSTPAVVALAQWIAFISYQARLACGLSALKAWRTHRPQGA